MLKAYSNENMGSYLAILRTLEINLRPCILIFYFNFYFLQFTFSSILHLFQLYSVVVRPSYTLQKCSPQYFQYPPGIIHSYYFFLKGNIENYTNWGMARGACHRHSRTKWKGVEHRWNEWEYCNDLNIKYKTGNFDWCSFSLPLEINCYSLIGKLIYFMCFPLKVCE